MEPGTNFPNINDNVSLSSTLERIQLQNSKSLWIEQTLHTRDISCERMLSFLNQVNVFGQIGRPQLRTIVQSRHNKVNIVNLS